MAANPLTPVEAAALAALVAPINNALTLIIANPTPLNVVAQFAAVQGNLIGALPVLEQIGIAGAASYLQQQIASAVASITPAPAVSEKK